MSINTTYLITGANRGIGLGLASALLLREETIVIATVRNLEHETTKALQTLPTGEGSKVIIIKIDSLSHTDPNKAVQELQTHYSVSKIDVVIANAGIGKHYGPAVSTPVDVYRDHFEVNALAPMVLFQATWPLLEKAKKPRFIAMSSRLGSIEELDFWAGLPGAALVNWMPAAPYGSSKAMLNYLLRRLHFEHENLIVFPLSPGWVQTDAGNTGANARGMQKATVTLEDSITGIMDRIDNATREETSGKFVSFDNASYNW